MKWPGAIITLPHFVITVELDSAVGCTVGHLGGRRRTQEFQTEQVRAKAGKFGSHTHTFLPAAQRDYITRSQTPRVGQQHQLTSDAASPRWRRLLSKRGPT